MKFVVFFFFLCSDASALSLAQGDSLQIKKQRVNNKVSVSRQPAHLSLRERDRWCLLGNLNIIADNGNSINWFDFNGQNKVESEIVGLSSHSNFVDWLEMSSFKLNLVFPPFDMNCELIDFSC